MTRKEGRNRREGGTLWGRDGGRAVGRRGLKNEVKAYNTRPTRATMEVDFLGLFFVFRMTGLLNPQNRRDFRHSCCFAGGNVFL